MDHPGYWSIQVGSDAYFRLLGASVTPAIQGEGELVPGSDPLGTMRGDRNDPRYYTWGGGGDVDAWWLLDPVKLGRAAATELGRGPQYVVDRVPGAFLEGNTVYLPIVKDDSYLDNMVGAAFAGFIFAPAVVAAAGGGGAAGGGALDYLATGGMIVTPAEAATPGAIFSTSAAGGTPGLFEVLRELVTSPGTGPATSSLLKSLGALVPFLGNSADVMPAPAPAAGGGGALLGLAIAAGLGFLVYRAVK